MRFPSDRDPAREPPKGWLAYHATTRPLSSQSAKRDSHRRATPELRCASTNRNLGCRYRTFEMVYRTPRSGVCGMRSDSAVSPYGTSTGSNYAVLELDAADAHLYVLRPASPASSDGLVYLCEAVLAHRCPKRAAGRVVFGATPAAPRAGQSTLRPRRA